uniref:Uncharacterized protein n=1 Tax=Utricularia reniformis TaxID=192314 RepID=A0A1Y0B3C7_9LAMI|nr:hypothetical protein AEK19_MT1733 [Utricularia reniformis]ART31911.1 hypothetical protein AEK19_MT1733 [Utricularia reniformis]
MMIGSSFMNTILPSGHSTEYCKRRPLPPSYLYGNCWSL